MDQALAIAAASMNLDATRLQTIANNLANVGTTGFKREIAIKQAATLVFDRVLKQVNIGAPVNIQAIDMRAGALRQTGNPLDLAIEGGGFFEVRTSDGSAYTRAGNFHLDRLSQLVNSAGHVVMGVGGPIVLSTPTPVIDKNGAIYDGSNKQIGQIKMVSFIDQAKLNYLGGGLFDAGDLVPQSVGQDGGQVRQGFVEASNVVSTQETLGTMEVVRHFESMQKIIQGSDSMRDSIIQKLGSF